MTKVESAEEFVHKWSRSVPGSPLFLEAVKQRDAAVRAEALRECVRLCRELWEHEFNAGPDQRIGDGSPDAIKELTLRILKLPRLPTQRGPR